MFKSSHLYKIPRKHIYIYIYKFNCQIYYIKIINFASLHVSIISPDNWISNTNLVSNLIYIFHKILFLLPYIFYYSPPNSLRTKQT